MTALRSPFSAGFTDHAAADLAYAMKALGEPNRLKILALLRSNGPMAIHQLIAALGTVEQETVSHHVKKLVEVGLVAKRRIGRQTECRLVPGRLNELARLLDVGGRR